VGKKRRIDTWQIPRIRLANINLRNDGGWQREGEDLTL